MDLILKIVSEFYHIDNIGVIIDTFYSAYILNFMHYWKACFYGFELKKMNFFCRNFINFSFTFLFIVISIITMVTKLL